MIKTTDFVGRSEKTTPTRGLFGRSSNGMTTVATERPENTSTQATLGAQSGVSPVAQPIPNDNATNTGVPPAAEKTVGNRLLVGPDVKLKGAEILDCDTLVVEGRVEATMDSHIVRIAEQGVFSGIVSIDTAEIHGLFEGELTARSHLIIHATGRVSGKIRYGKITIEEGGQLGGDIQSIAQEVKPVSTKPGPGPVSLAANS
jgi:cytoskeletal protein CcmA (bactofilin family)